MAELIDVAGPATTIGSGGGVVIYDVNVNPDTPWYYDISATGSGGGGGGGLPIPPEQPVAAAAPTITEAAAAGAGIAGTVATAEQIAGLVAPWFFGPQQPAAAGPVSTDAAGFNLFPLLIVGALIAAVVLL